VALSSLASVVSKREGDNPGGGYLAGLWQSSLPPHLLWTTEKVETIKMKKRGPDSK
jgi:hypothetical protein